MNRPRDPFGKKLFLILGLFFIAGMFLDWAIPSLPFDSTPMLVTLLTLMVVTQYRNME